MVRDLLLAAAALLLTAAAKPTSVDYRLGVEPLAGRAPLLTVQMDLRGDADGETVLDLPDSFASGEQAWRYVSDLTVKGAKVSAPDPAHRVLRHKPGARLTVRYRVQSAYAEDPKGGANPYNGPIVRPDWFAGLGEFVFAVPHGRDAELATFAWDRLPAGWRAASDLEHGAMGQRLSVADIRDSISFGGSRLALVERPIPGGTLRLAAQEGGLFDAQKVADETARIITAERAFWNDQKTPYFVALVPLAPVPNNRSIGGTGRGDGFVLYATVGDPQSLQWTLAHEQSHTWIAPRIGRLPAKDEAAAYWLSEGFTDFFTMRALLRAEVIATDDVVLRLADTLRTYDASAVRTAPVARIVADYWKDPAVQQLPYQRGVLLALKWDEAIRRKTAGKADLDDAILRMRDHYQQFAPGQGPDVVTGLVSAVWVIAGLDIRPDIVRYADGGAVIDLPDEMFDGCLQARVTVSPGFDPGFDTKASFAAKTVKGVRRRGPAWTGGLRDGMVLDAWTFREGDTTQQVELTVHTGRGKPRRIAYWPYGDNDQQSRKLQITPGTRGEALKTCGRKIAGL